MTWTEGTVVRILLMVAQLIAKEEWRKEIATLATHISAGDWRNRGAA